MKDECCNCKYFELIGDANWSKWVCKKHNYLFYDGVCEDYVEKGKGFEVNEGTFVLVMISLMLMILITLILSIILK